MDTNKRDYDDFHSYEFLFNAINISNLISELEDRVQTGEIVLNEIEGLDIDALRRTKALANNVIKNLK